MKNRFALLLAFLSLHSGILSAQYIWNGDFSRCDINNCWSTYTPLGGDYLNAALTGWWNGTAGTSDYFNARFSDALPPPIGCGSYAPICQIGIPSNYFGWQQDASSSVPPGHRGGYAGIAITDGYYTSNGEVKSLREYIRQQLNSPLIAGIPYRVRYKVSLAENRTSQLPLPSNVRIGAYFSTADPYVSTTDTALPVIPQIQGMPVSPYINLNNRTAWIPIEEVIIPSQNMNWITIGNFQPKIIEKTYSKQTLDYYFYIDDVDITELSPTACDCYFDVLPPVRTSFNPCCYDITIKSLPGACKVYKIVLQDIVNSSIKKEKLFSGGFSPGSSTTINYCLEAGQEEFYFTAIFYTKDYQGNYVELCRRNPNVTNALRCKSPCIPTTNQQPLTISRIPGDQCCWEIKLTLGDKDYDYDLTDIGGFSLSVSNGSINDLAFSSSTSYWNNVVNSSSIHFTNPAANNNTLEHGTTYVIGKFCMDDPGISRDIVITTLDAQGQEKDCPPRSITISCPDDCCDAFDMQIVKPAIIHQLQPCTYGLYIFNTDASCKAQKVTITVNGNTTVYTPPAPASNFSFGTGPMGVGSSPFITLVLGASAQTITVTIEIKDSNGNIIQCTKTFTIACSGSGTGGNKQGEQGNIELESDLKSSCLKWVGSSTVEIDADCIAGAAKDIRVVDAMGRMVNVSHRYDAASNSFVVDLDSLSSGAYFIHISSSEQSVAYPILWTK